MPKKQTIETEAIVLRCFPSGDYDMVYRLLTADFGKLSAFARSVKRSKKRFNSFPEPFDIGKAELKEGRGDLLLFNGFQSSMNPLALRSSLKLFQVACTVCECFDLLMPDGRENFNQAEHPGGIEEETKANRSIFENALDCIQSLSSVDKNSLSTNEHLQIAHHSLRKLLRVSGYLHQSENEGEQEKKDIKAEWEKILHRIEQVIEKPLKTRI